MNTRWFSLRRRLLLLLLGGLSLFWLVTLALSYVDAHHEIDELFDAQLAQSAQTLLALMRDNDAHRYASENAELAASLHKYQRKLRFQIWRDDGYLLLRSPNAPIVPMTHQSGFSSSGHDTAEQNDRDLGQKQKQTLHTYRWRNLSLWDTTHRYQVQVSENHDIRNELSGKIAGRLLLPVLFGLPLLAIWLWLATRKGLASLDDIARQIAQRHADRLDAVLPQSAPDEIRPLIEALNRLFERVRRALENERRFTADAAHELRTPLAALAAQAQVAQRARDNSDELARNHALDQLRVGISRATHLVDQLLTLARLDPDDALGNRFPVDFQALAEEVCAEHGASALEKQLTLELDTEPSVGASLWVSGSATLLHILLRNLQDNAIRYTPAHGQVHVLLQQETTGVRLSVSDSGAGIAEDQRIKVFERFQRLAEPALPGSGLGLSIVQRIAELHGAQLWLDSSTELGGLAVHVRFSSIPSPQ